MTLPPAEIVLLYNSPRLVAPVLDTTNILAMFAELMLTVPSSTMLILLVPLAIPEIPPML